MQDNTRKTQRSDRGRAGCRRRSKGGMGRGSESPKGQCRRNRDRWSTDGFQQSTTPSIGQKNGGWRAEDQQAVKAHGDNAVAEQPPGHQRGNRRYPNPA